MPDLIKCHRKSCQRDQYPNQIKQIETPEGVIYSLCADCFDDLFADLSSKGFVGKMIRGEMTPGEWNELAREKAEMYAMSDFDMGVGA